LQAAMGLAVLPYMEEILVKRKSIVKGYDNSLDFNYIKKIKIRKGTEWNYSYYPVIFEKEEQLLKVQTALNSKEIYPRRYFYPSLNHLPYVKDIEMPVSENISKNILCLPLSSSIENSTIELIVQTINQSLSC